MSHEIAKLLLEHAGTFLARQEAVKTALSMGMPLKEIEEYLDWLDASRPVPQSAPNPADQAASSVATPETSATAPAARETKGTKPVFET